MHVDGASGAMIAPFLDPDLEWDFRLPRVASINTSGHKYGLVYPGVGWVVWRDADALPEDLIFWVNYLGDNMPTFALNFSRPGAQVVSPAGRSGPRAPRARDGARRARRFARREAARSHRRRRSALSESRSAVGSSSTTSGASRRNARASASRRRCPVESWPPAVPDDRLVATAEAARRTRAHPRARPHRARARRRPTRSPRRMLSATVPAEERRALRHEGRPPRASASRRAARGRRRPRGSGPTSDRRAARATRRACSSLPRSARRSRASRPAGSRDRRRAARRRRGRVRERDALEPDRNERRIRRRSRPARAMPARLRELEEPFGDGRAVRARVELRGEVAERQVELRREDEHGERRLEADPALGEPHARPRRRRARCTGSPRARGSLPRGTPTRSVRIVVRRYSSLTSAMRAACA